MNLYERVMNTEKDSNANVLYLGTKEHMELVNGLIAKTYELTTVGKCPHFCGLRVIEVKLPSHLHIAYIP